MQVFPYSDSVARPEKGVYACAIGVTPRTQTRTRHAGFAVVLAALSIVFPAPLSVRATTSHDDEEVSWVAGHWEGTVQDAKRSIGVKLDIDVDDSGTLSGTATIPYWGSSSWQLKDIRAGAHELEFQIGDERPITFRGVRIDDRIIGSCTWGKHPWPFRVIRGRDETSDHPRRPQTPGPPFPYHCNEVRYSTVGEVRIAGTVTRPMGARDRSPAILLLGGSEPRNRNEFYLGHQPFLVIADHLTRLGFVVLRTDDRGVGGSTGTRGTASYEELAVDARAALALLLARPDVDPRRVGMLGMSEGAIVAQTVAADNDGIAFLIMVGGLGVSGLESSQHSCAQMLKREGAPGDVLDQYMSRRQRVLMMARDGSSLAEIVRTCDDPAFGQIRSAEGMLFGSVRLPTLEEEARYAVRERVRKFLAYQPADSLRRVRCPVLALSGGLDLIVDGDTNLRAMQEALSDGGNSGFTGRLLPGLNHGLQPAKTGLGGEVGEIETTIDDAAFQALDNWVRERDGDGYGKRVR